MPAGADVQGNKPPNAPAAPHSATAVGGLVARSRSARFEASFAPAPAPPHGDSVSAGGIGGLLGYRPPAFPAAQCAASALCGRDVTAAAAAAAAAARAAAAAAAVATTSTYTSAADEDADADASSRREL